VATEYERFQLKRQLSPAQAQEFVQAQAESNIECARKYKANLKRLEQELRDATTEGG
jgi:hypothetical protein